MVEQLLQLLVGVVDAQLLKGVDLEQPENNKSISTVISVPTAAGWEWDWLVFRVKKVLSRGCWLRETILREGKTKVIRLITLAVQVRKDSILKSRIYMDSRYIRKLWEYYSKALISAEFHFCDVIQ